MSSKGRLLQDTDRSMGADCARINVERGSATFGHSRKISHRHSNGGLISTIGPLNVSNRMDIPSGVGG
jgi:hypothetical protein